MTNGLNNLTNLHRTAFSAAALRAAHTLENPETAIFRDELALGLAGMSPDEVLALANRVPTASASTCILRSRYTEDRLAIARERLNQYVILGAGLDSYALRMGDQLGNLAVFEVDDPIFLVWKRQKVESLSWKVPKQLRLVPCNFEQMTLTQALANSDFAEDKPCFISWLGVTQYLTHEAIRETLNWAGQRSKGSEIVLTFLNSNAYTESLKSSMAANDVAVLSDFTPTEMTQTLVSAGFTHIEHFTADDAKKRYFQNRNDGLCAPESQCLVAARV